jgi:hypothetical protein
MAYTDILYCGPVPCEEDTAQTGKTDDWAKYQRIECEAYIQALRNAFGPEPEGARLRVKTESHDFGSYKEVVCDYDGNVEAAAAYASKCEEGLTCWEDGNLRSPVLYGNDSQALYVDWPQKPIELPPSPEPNISV